jgi:hypothetical protein
MNSSSRYEKTKSLHKGRLDGRLGENGTGMHDGGVEGTGCRAAADHGIDKWRGTTNMTHAGHTSN